MYPRLVLPILFVVVLCTWILVPGLHAAPLALPVGFTREVYASGFTSPTAIAFDRDGNMLVAQKGGRIDFVLPGGTTRAEPYLILNVDTEKERGLSGLALDPAYPDQPYVYVYYTTGAGALDYTGTPENRVSRFTTVNGVGANEKILLDHIPSITGEHNAGDIQFGFGGKLMIAVGDGGEQYRGQLRNTLNGKILRLNRNGKIPKTNPFYNRDLPRKEIFALGFRNPYRFAARAATHAYFVADVGWGEWEEVSVLKKGGNFGWATFEGPCPNNVDCDPDNTDFGKTIPPVYYYHHRHGDETGSAIIGGVFVENSNYPPPYEGAYFYSDFGQGWIHYLIFDENNQLLSRNEFDVGVNASEFRMGSDGNLYVIDIWPGEVERWIYTP